MASAYGLALQGLEIAAIDTNLLPIEVAKANLWRAKRPWFAGAAAAVVVGVGIQCYESWSNNRVYGKVSSSEVEGVDPNRAQVMRQNDQALAEQINTKKAFDAIGTPADFAKAQTQVESYRRLATDRRLWPMIMGDIMMNLPQARKPVDVTKVARTDQQIMVITLLKSDYLSSDDWAGWGLATAVAPGTPVQGGPQPAPAAAPGAAAPAAPAAAAPEEMDHGFGITIIGYTPLPQTRRGAAGPST
jgi:hypothetical protein